MSTPSTPRKTVRDSRPDDPPQVADLRFENQWIDNYNFIHKLGVGGTAAVWLADEYDIQRRKLRQVAIKVFVPNRAKADSFRQTTENFRRDLRIAAELARDNPIVQIYNNFHEELFLDDKRIPKTVNSRSSVENDTRIVVDAFFIVMEFADGGHLGEAYREQVIQQDPHKSWRDHFLDICKALTAAHENGVFHRDVKPQNVLWFKKENRIKVTDFGAAQSLQDNAFDDEGITGTPPYMAPEAFKLGVRGTAARDVYALGCTFYEILTGEKPFSLPIRSPNTPPQPLLEEWEDLHSSAERPTVMEKKPGLASIRLSLQISRMMDPNPAKRPSLQRVIETLKVEKPRTAYPETTFGEAPSPLTVKFLSDYDLHPRFRQDVLREQVVFLLFGPDLERVTKWGCFTES